MIYVILNMTKRPVKHIHKKTSLIYKRHIFSKRFLRYSGELESTKLLNRFFLKKSGQQNLRMVFSNIFIALRNFFYLPLFEYVHIAVYFFFLSIRLKKLFSIVFQVITNFNTISIFFPFYFTSLNDVLEFL